MEQANVRVGLEEGKHLLRREGEIDGMRPGFAHFPQLAGPDDLALVSAPKRRFHLGALRRRGEKLDLAITPSLGDGAGVLVHCVARRRDGEKARRAALAGELGRTGAGGDEHHVFVGGEAGHDANAFGLLAIAFVELGELHLDAAEAAVSLLEGERETVALVTARPGRPGR